MPPKTPWGKPAMGYRTRRGKTGGPPDRPLAAPQVVGGGGSMSRSVKKGPFVEARLLGRVQEMNKRNERKVVKTWSRASVIFPDFIGHTIAVYNGKQARARSTSPRTWSVTGWASSPRPARSAGTARTPSAPTAAASRGPERARFRHRQVPPRAPPARRASSRGDRGPPGRGGQRAPALHAAGGRPRRRPRPQERDRERREQPQPVGRGPRDRRGPCERGPRPSSAGSRGPRVGPSPSTSR